MAKLTSPKIREAESTAGWYTLIAWCGCVLLFVFGACEQWIFALCAFPFTILALVIAIRAGHEVNDCQAIALALKEKREEDVKALYGKERTNE